MQESNSTYPGNAPSALRRASPGGQLRGSTAPKSEFQAHREAARAVVCFVLYGERVIREVGPVGASPEEAGGMKTFSLLPIPLVCRPSSGLPRRGNPAPVSGEAIVDAHGILAYAASVGERLFRNLKTATTPDALDEGERFGFMRDREGLGRLADTLRLERPAETFFPEYWEEAERLLRAHWAGVSTLAEALIQHGSLSGERIDDLLLDVFPV